MSLRDDLHRSEKSDFHLRIEVPVNLAITYSNSFRSLFIKKIKKGKRQVGRKQTSIVVIQENRTLVS